MSSFLYSYDSPAPISSSTFDPWAGRLTIRGDLNDRLSLGSTEDQGARDNRVVGFTEDTDGTEEVFPGSLETVEETADLPESADVHYQRILSTHLVRGHEDLCKLLVVLEVDPPDGESLLVEPA